MGVANAMLAPQNTAETTRRGSIPYTAEMPMPMGTKMAITAVLLANCVRRQEAMQNAAERKNGERIVGR